MLTGRRLGLPTVGQVEQVTPLDRGADAAPERADVLVGSTADSKSGVTVLARLVGDGHVAVEVPLEERPYVIVLVGDEAVHRHHGIHDYGCHTRTASDLH